MGSTKKKLYELVDAIREFLLVARLWLPDIRSRARKPVIPVIASLTSYTPRIRGAWISIETLLRQSVRPQKLLLVLYEQEFPERLLPRRLQAQTKRGLEIMWVDRNGKSYDKLLPVRRKYPNTPVVTFDDDKFFPTSLLADLYSASVSNPGAIVGSRGWIVRNREGAIHYGDNWVRANPGSKGRNILTPGGNGCLYPPDSLDPYFDDVNLALRLCPTADDIWFWFAAQKAETSIYCLGLSAHRKVHRQGRTPALSDTNSIANDEQFEEMKKLFPLDHSHFDSDE